MKPDMQLVIEFKKERNNKRLLEKLQIVYLEGLKDGSRDDLIFDYSKRFLHVPKNTKYECVCPNCGESLELDIEELLRQQENGENSNEE